MKVKSLTQKGEWAKGIITKRYRSDEIKGIKEGIIRRVDIAKNRTGKGSEPLHEE